MGLGHCDRTVMERGKIKSESARGSCRHKGACPQGGQTRLAAVVKKKSMDGFSVCFPKGTGISLLSVTQCTVHDSEIIQINLYQFWRLQIYDH